MKELAYLTKFVKFKSIELFYLKLIYKICQSSVCPDPVRFPALSQIKPHAPRVLVVPFRQFLQVSHLRAYYPRKEVSQTFLQ